MTQNTPENKSNKTIEASTDQRVSISAIEDAKLASKDTKSLSQGSSSSVASYATSQR
ncbi:hypothetical protein QP228_004595 [Pseudoglutamicibacter cumminsii]|uniref:hypothetical protein n=1 Tax=Pseudoglutamicibacter cumminsii TaxID=156979 RepID=UPI002AB8D667|nr:hypothetical protein [Pseudoglutamicibacter cumminsii]MDZ3745277.1 hypothetical protein [Pseudoglutamicibacter cumminsii]